MTSYQQMCVFGSLNFVTWFGLGALGSKMDLLVSVPWMILFGPLSGLPSHPSKLKNLKNLLLIPTREAI
jgi:hypothetical protein